MAGPPMYKGGHVNTVSPQGLVRWPVKGAHHGHGKMQGGESEVRVKWNEARTWKRDRLREG